VLNPAANVVDTEHLPYYYRDNVSAAWHSISQNNGNGTESARAQMWPHNQKNIQYAFTHAPEVNGQTTNPFALDIGVLADSGDTSSNGWFDGDAEPPSRVGGHPGVAPFGEQGRMSFLVQPHIISNQPGDVQIIGIIDGLQNVYGRGLTAFEDLVLESGARFLTFPDTNSPQLRHWIAMEKV
jgi:hypothetical protein